MNKLQPTSAQKQAIEQVDKNILVTAGAGSGKTFVLVQRFVQILQKQPNIQVNNLLAVTYTRKAAKEMRTRIKASLKELYEQAIESGSEDYKRWHKCLVDMDKASIGTIHSLCQSILQNFAIEAGIDPQIETIDAFEQAQIIEETTADTFREVLATEYCALILEHFSLEELASFLKNILYSHLQFNQITAQLEGKTAAQLEEELAQLLAKTQKQLLTDLSLDQEWQQAGIYVSTNVWPDERNELESIRQQAAEYFQTIKNELSGSVESDKVKWQYLLALQSVKRPGNLGGRSEEAKQLRAAIKTLIAKSEQYNHQLPIDISLEKNNLAATKYWQLLKEFLFLAKKAIDIYREKKAEVQKLDFDDMIAQVSNLLQMENSAIRKYYNEKLEHILVDEFQDTNPIQSNIISALAGPQTKLFLIGDDKQSIYKFQGADVSTFNSWQKKYKKSEQAGNGHITLEFEHSFRSAPNIVTFVNDVFSVLLHADYAHVDYRACYRSLLANRSSGTDVEIIQLPDLKDYEQYQYLSQADIEGWAVANWIKEKIESGATVTKKDGSLRAIDYGDFAILVPKNSNFKAFESALSKANIPFVTSGGKTFLQRQEVYDLENMLLFLCNPSDSHALLGVLRSPMFAISDDIIHNLVQGMIENTGLWHAVRAQAEKKAPGYQILSEAVFVLRRLLSDYAVLSLPQLIYRIIRETNYDLIVLSLPQGKQRYKNIWKFYTLASEKEEMDAAEFAQYLELSRQLQVKQANATIDNRRSVKLMTIHASKGLEFPAVALPVLSSKNNGQRNNYLLHQEYGLVLNTCRTKEERENNLPLPFHLGKLTDEEMEIAERKRLLYVAMTRAKDYLALFIKEKDNRGELPANWLRPLVGMEENAISFGIEQAAMQLVKEPVVRASAGIGSLAIGSAVTGPLVTDSVVPASNLIDTLIDEVVGKDANPAHSLLGVSKIGLQENDLSALTGTFFHKLMEHLPKDEKTLAEDALYAIVEQLASELIHPPHFQSVIEEGKKMLALYAESELQKLLSTAKTICHEWSYYIDVAEEKNKLNIARPDLLFETEAGKWYLVDYKTDRFSIIDRAKDIEQHALRHRKQLEKYGRDFFTLTGRRAQLAIYFAQHGILHLFEH